jgi:hypothetical protein
MTMRGPSLQALRNRVARLAAECQVDDADTTIVVHWINPYDACPRCGYDLFDHVRSAAFAKAQAEDGPDAPPRRVIFCWTGTLTACPACGATLRDSP